MPSSGSRVRRKKPYAVVRVGGSTLSFHLADCVDVFRALAPGSVSAIVTSPPYNLGVRYRSYDDTVPRSDYLAWTDSWVAAARAALSPGGSLFLNLGAKPTDPWTAMDIAQAARKHLQLQNTLHWIKSIAIDKDAVGGAAALDRDLAVGHYKPINSRRFVNDCHEFVFHFTPAGTTPLDRAGIGVEYQDASNIGRWRAGAGNRRCRGNAWFIPYDTIKSRDRDRPHPATFPPRLAEYCFRLHGPERISVAMDPFLGLGSSAIAAAQLGLDFVGVEIDEHYLKEAIARLKAQLNSRGFFAPGPAGGQDGKRPGPPQKPGPRQTPGSPRKPGPRQQPLNLD
jgi:site-specific DNA-methyltransferase (adenine-specific)